MLAILSGLFVGAVFGAGLAISRMMDPAKVIGFLDFAGDWDPTLGVVIAAALAVDAPLLAGTAVFGIGWGLSGFCPGPALAALSTGRWSVTVFVAAMLAGMILFRLLPRR